MPTHDTHEREQPIEPSLMFVEPVRRYGYFFVDLDRQRLELFARVAASSGYSVISLRAPRVERGASDPDPWTLHLASIHGVRRASARYLEIEALAASHGVSLFRGIEVRNRDGSLVTRD